MKPTMMTKLAGAIALVALMVATACSGKGDSAAAASTDPPLGLSDNALRFALDPYTVEPGDSLECFYTNVTTDRELYVNRASGKQGVGGHHVTIYYNDGDPGPVGHHPCNEAEMTQWDQVGGAGNEGTGVADLPTGVAIKVPQNKQMVVQTHYINASGKSYQTQDEITVYLLKQEEVTRFANAFVVIDSAFEIPPQSNYKRTTTCVVDQDLDLVVLLGHMHENGSHYTLERIDEQGTSLETYVDNVWDPSFASHPPAKKWTPDAPQHIAKGTRLRQTCAWQNTTDASIRFPHEMCLAFSYYLDDRGFITCNATPETTPAAPASASASAPAASAP